MNRRPTDDPEPTTLTEGSEDQPTRAAVEGGMDRRTFLKTVGVGVAAAALTQSVSPLMFARAQGTGAVKLGLLEDRSGDFALFGAPKYHGAQLAVAEINQGLTLAGGPVGPGGFGVSAMRAADPPAQRVADSGRLQTTSDGGQPDIPGVIHAQEDQILIPSGDEGINGRPLELIAADPQSDNTLYQRLARRLILDDQVDVLFAGFSSASREATRPIINQLNTLYFYNNQYEGGVADKNTFCTGAVAEQQIAPAMEFMVRNFGPRIYILAADYNFGHLSAAWTKAFAPMLGAQIVGEEYIPLEVSEFSTVISRLQRAEPDWVMMYITGENHANYYPQANAAGVRFPMGSSINMAQGYEHLRFSAPALQDMHVAVNYMQEIPTARNLAFVERWHAMFPDEPYISQQAQNSYNAVHLYAKAARLAGTTEKDRVTEALESGMHMEAPEGSLFMEPGTHHCSHYIRLAHADGDHNISFIREWPMIEAWWLQRLGVNLVRHPEAKQYEPDEDPFFQKFA